MRRSHKLFRLLVAVGLGVGIGLSIYLSLPHLIRLMPWTYEHAPPLLEEHPVAGAFIREAASLLIVILELIFYYAVGVAFRLEEQ